MTRLQQFAERVTREMLIAYWINEERIDPDDKAAARAVLEREVRTLIVSAESWTTTALRKWLDADEIPPQQPETAREACKPWCGSEVEPAPGLHAWLRNGRWYCAGLCSDAQHPLNPPATPKCETGTPEEGKP